MVKVDYIIAGGGAAGLSLALRMVDSDKIRRSEEHTSELQSQR